MSAVTNVIKSIGSAFGETVVKEWLTDNLSEREAENWQSSLFGTQINYRKQLDGIEGKIDGLKNSLNELGLDLLYDKYIDAKIELVSSLETLIDRKNNKECNKALHDSAYSNGGLVQTTHRFKNAVFTTGPEKESCFLSRLLKKLVDKHTDIYTCLKVFNRVEHDFFATIGAAISFTQKLDSKKICVSDDEAWKECVKGFESHTHHLRVLAAQIDEIVENKIPIRLQHRTSEKYRSGYAPGPWGATAPFELYNRDEDMPQVFLYQKAHGQVETYRKSDVPPLKFSPSLADLRPKQPWEYQTIAHTVEMKEDLQYWRVYKAETKEGTALIFQSVGAFSNLARPNGDGEVVCVWSDTSNAHWYLIADKVETANRSDSTLKSNMWFMLRSLNPNGRMLESDGSRCYANRETPDYNEQNIKWRVADYDAPGRAPLK